MNRSYPWRYTDPADLDPRLLSARSLSDDRKLTILRAAYEHTWNTLAAIHNFVRAITEIFPGTDPDVRMPLNRIHRRNIWRLRASVERLYRHSTTAVRYLLLVRSEILSQSVGLSRCGTIEQTSVHELVLEQAALLFRSIRFLAIGLNQQVADGHGVFNGDDEVVRPFDYSIIQSNWRVWSELPTRMEGFSQINLENSSTVSRQLEVEYSRAADRLRTPNLLRASSANDSNAARREARGSWQVPRQTLKLVAEALTRSALETDAGSFSLATVLKPFNVCSKTIKRHAKNPACNEDKLLAGALATFYAAKKKAKPPNVGASKLGGEVELPDRNPRKMPRDCDPRPRDD